MSKTRLKIAIQKKGKLYQESINLFKWCGLKFRIKENALLCHCENLPIDLLFVRDDDIPIFVADQICDLGIVGKNILIEKQYIKNNSLKEIKELGFGFCRLAIAVPEPFNYINLNSLQNLKIATSYPNALKSYLTEKNINAQIIVISGSVEIAPKLSVADAICDLVSTGTTLEENQLYEVETLFASEAILIQTLQSLNIEKNRICNLLLRRIEGVIQARESKYIMFHIAKKQLCQVGKILPGSELPTIMALNGTDHTVAVHVVSREAIFWGTLEKLKEIGASSILVLPVEKMLA